METKNVFKISKKQLDLGYYLFGSIFTVLIFYALFYGTNPTLKFTVVLSGTISFIFDLLNSDNQEKLTFRTIISGIIVGLLILTEVIPSPFK
jgi:hypothetical protein